MIEQELIYSGIEIVLVTEFPELRDRMQSTFGSYYDLTSEFPEAYPVFEDVFWDFVVESLSKDDSEQLLERAFLFCERMASSRDLEVVNLLWIAIIEPLVSDAYEVQQAWKYIGPKTRILAREVAGRGGWESNLPQA
jgi:hypothetical protein